jgi:hypothetical protein
MDVHRFMSCALEDGSERNLLPYENGQIGRQYDTE